MKGYVKEHIDLVGTLPIEKAREKWDNEVEAHKLRREEKLRGEAIFKLREENGKILVDYHHCYRKDFCDTCFEGQLMGYNDNTSAISGEIKKPKGIMRFAWLWLIIGTVIDFALYLIFIYNTTIWPFLGALVVIAGVFVMTLRIEDVRKKPLVDYLRTFLNDTSKAELFRASYDENEDFDDLPSEDEGAEADNANSDNSEKEVDENEGN